MLVAVLAGVASSVGDSGYLPNHASEVPDATGVDYLNKVKALYDTRNECLHGFAVDITEVDKFGAAWPALNVTTIRIRLVALIE